MSYYEATLNLVFRLSNVEYTYQNLFKKFDDQDFNAYIEYLCNPRIKWVEAGSEKAVRRMDMRSESKVWYHFVKYSLRLLRIMRL